MSAARAQFEEAERARNQGSGALAAALYREALAEAEAEGAELFAAEAAHMMGVAYKVDDDFPRAIVALEDAAERYRHLGRIYDMGRVLRDIGISFDNAGQHEQGLSYLERSVKQLASCLDTAELGISEAKLGWHYLQTGHTQKAKAWLDKGLINIRRQGNWFYEMTTLWHLARWEMFGGDFAKARELLEQAIRLVRENDHDRRHGRRLAQLYGGLARCDAELGDKTGARANVKLAEAYLAPMSADSRAFVEAEIGLDGTRERLRAPRRD